MIYGFSVVPTVHPTSSSSVRTLMPVMYFVIYSSNFAVMYSALGSSSEMPSVTEDALPFSGYRSTSGYRSSSGYSPEDCKVVTSNLPLRFIRPKPPWISHIHLSIINPVQLSPDGCRLLLMIMSSLINDCSSYGIPKCCNNDSRIALSVVVP